MSMVIVYTDGGARGNPGPAGAGVVIHLGNETIELKRFLGEKQTNNWAEYEAVAIALEELKSRGLTDRPLAFRLDSKLVVEQILGNWKIKEPTLKPQAAKVHALLAAFPSYTFTHVPRAENSEADALVNRAIDEALL